LSARRTPARLVYLDTGPLYALGAPGDEHHARAVRAFAALAAAPGLSVRVPAPVALEIHRLRLYRKPSDPAALRELRAILARFPVAHPTPAQFGAALDLLETHAALKATLTDALLAAMSASEQAEVLTFDTHLGVLGARVRGEG